MISVRRYASLMWVTGLFAGGLATVLLPRAARAQTYEGDVPPAPDEYETQPEDVPADALPPPQAPDQNTFQRALSPYGRWVDTADYGRVWVPYETDSDWQPYTDGRWVDTQWGWSFAPAVPWGWAAFHYGRWGFGVGLASGVDRGGTGGQSLGALPGGAPRESHARACREPPRPRPRR